ncbi:MAG: ABC transporter ATP-binding protein [Pseudomonadales bacterium]|nr:ABC transporter ATP-binding protein [Pseudomonadales bacterium]
MSQRIRLRQVQKYFETETIRTIAVDSIDLDIPLGEFLAIVGPSGSGKSSLLNVIGLLGLPSKGEVWFGEECVTGLPKGERERFRRSTMGYVFQSFQLLSDLSVFENIELPLKYRGISKSERVNIVERYAKSVQLESRIDHFPAELSGGQQQRVAIARALVTKPKVLLADEPTGNLDSESGDNIMKILREANESGTTVIVVTHSDRVSSQADRVVTMVDGNLQL